jgi:hypothetical protein
MNLDQVTLEIRPRSAWEAVDLGLLMAKRWWLPMMTVWLLASLPFFALALCIPEQYFWLSLLLLWWFKPLYERPLLHILSRAVFNELPDTRSTLKLFPSLALKHIFLSLTVRRFSPTRCMDLPVLQLEGLTGTRRQTRLSVLHREDSAPASWLSFIGLLLEIFLAVGMMSFIWSMIPRELEVEWANFFFDQENVQLLHLKLALWYAALGLTAPFYVACGFALYLNRRVKLEAWDIDIAFRRIANKRSGTTNPLALLCTLSLSLFLFLAAPKPVYAGDQLPAMGNDDAHIFIDKPLGEYQDIKRDQAQESIIGVMQQAEFSRKETKRTLTFIEKKEKTNWLFEFLEKNFGDFFKGWKDFKGFNLIANLLEIILWSAVLLLIALVIYRYRHWLAAQFVRVAPGNVTHSKPQTLFGMDVTQESLPDDISSNALHLLQQGNSRAALALLYRASLFQLIHKGVDIHDGHTEGECVQLMRELLPPLVANNKLVANKEKLQEQIHYFAELTQCWQQLAYGHQLPERSMAENLCRQWNPCWLLAVEQPSSATNKVGAQ